MNPQTDTYNNKRNKLGLKKEKKKKKNGGQEINDARYQDITPVTSLTRSGWNNEKITIYDTSQAFLSVLEYLFLTQKTITIYR